MELIIGERTTCLYLNNLHLLVSSRLRQMFGQSSLRNCGILNEINTVAPDNRVQQIEKLKYRFL